MKYLISNSQFNLIIEQVDFDDYDDSDFLDAFITLFRRWATKNLGDKSDTYPFSLLLKKYGKKFILDILGREYYDYHYSDNDDEFDINPWHINRLAKEIIKKGLHKLPSLQKVEKFTEKFKGPFSFILSNLNLPDWFRLEISEDKPYVVEIKPSIDFPKMLKSNEFFKGKEQIEREIEFNIKNYIGIDIGNPAHGELAINTHRTEFKNLEDWVKNDLNKVIKKHIRGLDKKSILHSIRFEPKQDKAILNLSFKLISGYHGRGELKNQIENYLWNELGYPERRIRVDV